MGEFIKAMDDFVKNLRESSSESYTVSFQKGNLEIISPNSHPKVFLIRNIITETIFSPSKDYEYLINLVREITE